MLVIVALSLAIAAVVVSPDDVIEIVSSPSPPFKVSVSPIAADNLNTSAPEPPVTVRPVSTAESSPKSTVMVWAPVELEASTVDNLVAPRLDRSNVFFDAPPFNVTDCAADATRFSVDAEDAFTVIASTLPTVTVPVAAALFKLIV
jgi:hypothetical protein